MASGLQEVVKAIQLSNYASLTILTAVAYDYVLTFANEIEYIWGKRWTRVSTLFFLARYFGLCSLIILTIVSSSFLPIPVKLILIHCGPFTFWIMIAAADLVMILRVWVLYHQSWTILSVLLPLYVIEVIGALIGCFFLRSQNNPADAALHISLCKLKPISLVLPKVVDSVQLGLGASMCLLLIARFIRESLQMYSATNQFQLSRYMSLLTRDGLFYFLAILLYALVNLLSYVSDVGNIPTSGWWILLKVAEYVPVLTLVPRLILSLRELYSRDLRGRCGTDIDTAFVPTSSSRRGIVPDRIAFADNAQNDVSERGDEIALEEWDAHGTSGI